MNCGIWLATIAALGGCPAHSAAAAPVLLAQSSAAEIEFWRSVESAKDPAELKAYLQAYPDGQFAPLAKLRLERLRGANEQDRSISDSAASAGGAARADTSKETAIPPAPPHKPRGWMGAEVRLITEARARELGLAAAGGAEIVRVVSGSPASRVDLRAQDVVLTVNAEAVRDPAHLVQLISAMTPGRTAEVTILRDGQRRTVQLTVGNGFDGFWAGAHRGDLLAMVSLGLIFDAGDIVDKDQREANKWFQRAADAGDRSAMRLLGHQYHYGQGVERNDREAFRWYERAAENGAGDAEAMFRLGLFYNRGQGVGRDLTQAARWYRLAAEKQHAGAMHNFGTLLQAGNGVAKDEVLAVAYFRKAAALNQVESFYTLGDAFYNGRGVAKDLGEAARWFREAANRGVGHGHTGLARLYESGEGGLPKSRVEAIKHYRKAAEAGHDFALERLKALKASAHDPQEMQTLLADLGFDPGPADGRPGAKTTQAIREFQKSRGLKVDGAASLALVGQLRDALKQKTATASAIPSPPAANAGPASDLGKLQHLEKLD